MKQFDIYSDPEAFSVSEADWVRTTVSIDAECLARFKQRASGLGMSLSKFMGMHLMLTESVADNALATTQ